MGEQNNPFSKFQLIYRRSSPLVKIVVIVAIVFSMLAVVAMSWLQNNIEEQTELLRGEAARLEHENEVLRGKISRLGSVLSDKEIAEEELGLVDPDTIIYQTE